MSDFMRAAASSCVTGGFGRSSLLHFYNNRFYFYTDFQIQAFIYCSFTLKFPISVYI